jgi:hypothetical protein
MASRRGSVFGSVLAIGVLGAGESGAGPAPAPFFDYQPFFTGKFDEYYAATVDLPGVKAKNARIARGCPFKKRGPRLQVQTPPAPATTSGFFSLFPDANQKRMPADMLVFIDPSGLKTPDSRAAFELDSPFVPIGLPVTTFTSLVVNREADGSLLVFVATTGGVNVGTPLPLPGDTPAVIGRVSWEGDLLSVAAGSCLDDPLTSLLQGLPFAFDGTAGVGAGITGSKGDAAGFSFALFGDLYDAAKQDLLGDLQAAIELEVAALVDLGSGQNANARQKAEDARVRIEDHGPPVDPPTVPESFEPDLLEKAAGISDPALRDEVVKRLQKAAERDARARDAIDKGGAKDLKKAQKELEKARDEKLRAKAMIDTGVVADAKGV